jgi:hypothetical protein
MVAVLEVTTFGPNRSLHQTGHAIDGSARLGAAPA